MTREEFIEGLNISFEYEEFGQDTLIKLDNSNDFSTLYNIISNSDETFIDEENSITTDSNIMFKFYSDDFEITLTADLIKDIYRCLIGDR